MNKTYTSPLILWSDTAKLCVRWKWKRKPISWCTSLSWKTEACAQRVSFIHAAADCQQNVKRYLKCRRLHEELPIRSTFPGKMSYLCTSSTILYLHFRHYRWQPHPEWFTVSASMQIQKAIRAQDMKLEQRNMTLQFLSQPNQISGCTGWPGYYSIEFVGMINVVKSKTHHGLDYVLDSTDHSFPPFTTCMMYVGDQLCARDRFYHTWLH